jgi:hypothetical protein
MHEETFSLSTQRCMTSASCADDEDGGEPSQLPQRLQQRGATAVAAAVRSS